MPVIINDFEVIVEPPPQGNSPASPPPAPPRLTPQDIERLMQHFQKRRARVQAD